MSIPTTQPTSPRQPIHMQTHPVQAIYRHLGDSTTIAWPATVRDISPTVIRLIAPRPVQPGKLLALRLYNPRQVAPISRSVLVVGFQCHAAVWILVCMFTDPLSEAEWHLLLEEN